MYVYQVIYTDGYEVGHGDIYKRREDAVKALAEDGYEPSAHCGGVRDYCFERRCAGLGDLPYANIEQSELIGGECGDI